jgi:hypothetical protein
MKKIILYIVTVLFLTNCSTEKTISTNNLKSVWEINYVKNQVKEDIVENYVNEKIYTNLRSNSKINVANEPFLASCDKPTKETLNKFETSIKNDLFILHSQINKKNKSKASTKSNLKNKKNAVFNNPNKDKVNEIAKLSKLSIRLLLTAVASLTIWGILISTGDFEISNGRILLHALTYIYGLISSAAGIILSFWTFFELKLNKIKVKEQEKNMKRNFRISSIISSLIVGAIMFSILVVASLS